MGEGEGEWEEDIRVVEGEREEGKRLEKTTEEDWHADNGLPEGGKNASIDPEPG